MCVGEEVGKASRGSGGLLRSPRGRVQQAERGRSASASRLPTEIETNGEKGGLLPFVPASRLQTESFRVIWRPPSLRWATPPILSYYGRRSTRLGVFRPLRVSCQRRRAFPAGAILGERERKRRGRKGVEGEGSSGPRSGSDRYLVCGGWWMVWWMVWMALFVDGIICGREERGHGV